MLPPSPARVVVSITDPDTPPALLGEGFRDVLRVGFWDVSAPFELAGEWLAPITPGQARTIVRFLDGWARSEDRLELICHCEAGVSRSAAVARFAAERYGLDLPHPADYPFANAAVRRELDRASRREAGVGI